MMMMILRMLSLQDLGRMCRVSRRFNQFIGLADELWEPALAAPQRFFPKWTRPPRYNTCGVTWTQPRTLPGTCKKQQLRDFIERRAWVSENFGRPLAAAGACDHRGGG